MSDETENKNKSNKNILFDEFIEKLNFDFIEIEKKY